MQFVVTYIASMVTVRPLSNWEPRPIERRLDWVFYKMEMKIWAVGCGLGWTVLKKVWADYEQLLREVFSTFCGKNFFFRKTSFF